MNSLELIVWLLLHNRHIGVCNNPVPNVTYTHPKYNVTKLCK